jgi:hypothetical protein
MQEQFKRYYETHKEFKMLDFAEYFRFQPHVAVCILFSDPMLETNEGWRDQNPTFRLKSIKTVSV